MLMTWHYLIKHLVLKGRLEAYKGVMESRGLNINLRKTKMMIIRENNRKVAEEGKFPCAVCRSCTSSHFILCHIC